jgi:dethiobiotin synthetase
MGASGYPPTVYVLGTDRDIGKTVTCIGIISNLIAAGRGYRLSDIGYIKPVGQETLTVLDDYGAPVKADKDAVLAISLLGVDSPGHQYSSPVVWADGVTAQYIDEAAADDPLAGREAFLARIREAYQRVAAGKRVVVAEGTGQPGVGSVAGLSNADVINALREMGVPLTVLLVTRGGIGSTIDQVFPYLVLLDHMGARADGLLINGVYPSKMDKIRHYITAYYERVFSPLYGDRLKVQHAPRIVGFVPSIEELRYPTMRLIYETLAKADAGGVEAVAPQEFGQAALALVRNVKVISLDTGFEPFLEPGDAVVVGVNSNDVIRSVLALHERMVAQRGEGLAGLILSCRQVGGLCQDLEGSLAHGDLPVLMVALDSARIVQRIDDLKVKIQPYDTGKKALIAAVFRDLALLSDMLP